MPSEEPALGVELKKVAVHRQHCTLGPVPAGELNQLARAGTISDCLCISVASLLPCSRLADALPPLSPAIVISFVFVVILIRTVATTAAILPAADSTATVWVRCHRCHVGGPVGGVDDEDDTVAADVPVVVPLPPSGAMDPMAAVTTKTLDGTVAVTATVTAATATTT